MYKETKSRDETAQVFYETGVWFDSLPDRSRVDMLEAYSDATISGCGSPACFGGWLAVKYNTRIDCTNSRFYKDGVAEFVRELGIETGCFPTPSEAISGWAYENSDVWGNKYGIAMFSCKSAFGVSDKEEITVKHIAKHLIGVAKRLDADVEKKFYANKQKYTPKITQKTLVNSGQ